MAKESVREEKINTKKLEKDLKDYINIQISDQFDKNNKRFLRDKNRRLFFKNIVILVLLAVICFLVYLLYKNDYFDKYFCNNKCVNETIIVEEKNETGNETVKELSLDELIDKYAVLLDKVIINDKSIYLNDFYNGKLSDELKTYG